ncbi:TrmB family transcriptional regulator [Halalkalicoccus jeotgali]|uniref:Transcriptional regulator TrmB n=1 Tax=Halalkalicoccus jeotgali (strain DSM 18796 / CECT 7217 / JCM 14584 / KCTC 4019 / B3) TaxID=795797 RepID=D8JAU8_HALJB|nr:TrmB family transcriptional regulator [Halalkalicoccus jeotgali]ADJ14820.1 transcriptional regulator, TrmB [Halalkalicoccus jeotgali B3]ELY39403.1 transcriptional regulator TrmB [Halalkalicoccus jeotgali B3]
MSGDEGDLGTILEEGGLSPYQAAAFVALLDLGSASARTIARASDVPDPRIYDVLRDLEADGYVETYEQDRLHARVSDLDRITDRLAARAERFAWASEEVTERYERPHAEIGEARIVGRFETVFDHARGAIERATDRVQASLTPEEFADLEPALAAAIDRGVDIQLSIHGNEDSMPATGTLAGACTEARYRPLPAPFVVLVDRSELCFVPHSDSINEYGVIVDDRTHAYVFHWFFTLCLWDVWEVHYSGRANEPPITYAGLRECLRAIEPELDAGRTVLVTVEGRWTDTGEGCSIVGQALECTYTTQSANVRVDPTIAAYAGRATLTVTTDDGPVSVGGWGATVEDAEVNRITVESIE